jgi:hypothetical protein
VSRWQPLTGHYPKKIDGPPLASELETATARPLKISTVMELRTLADMRELVERLLPAECRE